MGLESMQKRLGTTILHIKLVCILQNEKVAWNKRQCNTLSICTIMFPSHCLSALPCETVTQRFICIPVKTNGEAPCCVWTMFGSSTAFCTDSSGRWADKNKKFKRRTRLVLRCNWRWVFFVANWVTSFQLVPSLVLSLSSAHREDKKNERPPSEKTHTNMQICWKKSHLVNGTDYNSLICT